MKLSASTTTGSLVVTAEATARGFAVGTSLREGPSGTEVCVELPSGTTSRLDLTLSPRNARALAAALLVKADQAEGR